MAIKSFRVEKLIRDKIPDFLRAKGIVVHARVVESQEFILKLKNKLLEEAHEVLEADQSEEMCEELADLLEVIHTMSKASGLSMQQIEKKRLEKREIKGGFEKRIYNHSIDIEEDNLEINYYLKKALHYPEIK